MRNRNAAGKGFSNIKMKICIINLIIEFNKTQT